MSAISKIHKRSFLLVFWLFSFLQALVSPVFEKLRTKQK
jgi:hypothetical protein